MGKLVAYGGFSASNYLSQPYNSDLDFGTGDFCVMGWMKTGQTATTARSLAYRAYYSGSAWSDGLFRLEVLQSSSLSKIRLTLGYDGFTSSHNIIGDNGVADDVWHHVVAVRRNGTTELWVDGILNVTGSNSYDLSSTSATFMLGNRQDYSQPFTGGSLALWRISATAPSPEQIKKIYEDEKVLFQENAQATLYGSSDAVTALAYDDSTNILSVGTSAGRSDFQGLRRVNNTTNAVGAAISASNGMIVEE